MTELTLSQLNEATIAWVEFEYHRKLHSEIHCPPLDRYLQGPDAGRPCPDTADLRHAFCAEVKRRQRKSDGTFSLQGNRFEVPSHYRHLEELHIRYARWDLSSISLVDPHTHQLLCKLYPQDKLENASGLRRAFSSPTDKLEHETTKTGIAPLLKDLIAEYSATGFPPGYIPKEKNK